MMMGEYRNGKWTPTFGDEQFGVVDRPGEMYNRVRELEAENARLREELAARKAMDAYPNTLRDLNDD